MTRYFKALPITAVAMLAALAGRAQEQATSTATTGAIRQIPVSDQMFRKTIWRAIDLREKQNRPMFSDGKEISKVIMEAVNRGELQAYKNDSVTSTFSPAEVKGNMSYAIEAPIAVDGGDDWGSTPAPASSKAKKAAPANDGWGAPVASTPAPTTKKVKVLDSKGKPVKKNGKYVYRTVGTTSVAAAPPSPPATSAPYRYKDLYQMELTEEMIFDKKRSRMYHQIKTVSLKLPSTFLPILRVWKKTLPRSNTRTW